jgi:hypothetical protein
MRIGLSGPAGLVAGDEWGAVRDSWRLGRNAGGFLFLGGATGGLFNAARFGAAGGCGTGIIKSWSSFQPQCVGGRLKSFETVNTLYRDAGGCVSMTQAGGAVVDLCVPCACTPSGGSVCPCDLCDVGTGTGGGPTWTTLCVKAAGITGSWSDLNGVSFFVSGSGGCSPFLTGSFARPSGVGLGFSIHVQGYMDSGCGAVWNVVFLDHSGAPIFTGTITGTIV